jgi:hypothetical protein
VVLIVSLSGSSIADCPNPTLEAKPAQLMPLAARIGDWRRVRCGCRMRLELIKCLVAMIGDAA